MNYYALFPTIVAVLIGLMGFFVLYKNRTNRLGITYFFLSSSLFIWLMCFSLMYWNTNDYEFSYFIAKIGFIGVICTPVCALHFILEFLNSRYKKYIVYIYISVLPAIIVNFLSKLIYVGLSNNFWGYYPIAGKLYFIALAQFMIIFSVCVYILFKNLHNTNFSAIKQLQTKYLVVAFAIAVLGSGDYIIKYPFIKFYPFAYIVVIFFSGIIALCIIKTNLMDIKLAVTKTVIFIILYLCVLGLPLFIGFKTNQWIISSLILFILSTIGPMIIRYFQHKAEKILLAEQETYQQLLVQASKGMVDQQDLTKLSKLIVRIINKNVKVKFVSLFIKNEDKDKFYCISSRGILTINNGKEIHSDDKIIKYMKKIKKPFFFSNIIDDLQEVFTSISDGINMIVPSILRDELIGFLILGDKLNQTVYSSQDIEVFKTLSNQAGLAIENCYFLEKSKKQQERLFEAEKLASIGGMADGMAHQIKNRLHQFSMVGGELRMEVENFENNYKSFVCQEPKVEEMVRYLKEISDSIGVNVKKTNNVLQGILNFAKTTEKDTYFSFFSLKEIVEQSLELVKVKHQKDNIPLVLELPEGEKLYGVKSQVQEVIFNCIDNSVEAISEKEEHLTNSLLSDFKDEKNNINFNPEIKITLQYVNKSARIYIKDNGIGIKTENQPKIFSAFFTTKPSSRSGSGIGSYVVKRMIVENHKGDISFRSQYGIGTTFVINLPMSKNVQEVEILSN
ncbi:MAG: ATP-binding protein [Endomicrobiaceae bacterium]|nr:ATP-binding protein [Endomicrobiaceae bacterium]MDD3053126.1 ATP-binding protein [Endomicrobiaceae bacterium]MDD3922201.1 ATP-binding protein [Endomicrobiaceae bacterium]